MPLSDVVGMFGSEKPPTAVANRFAAPIMNAGRRLAVNTLNSIRPDIASAYSVFNSFQPRQEALAGDQEGVLRNLMNRRLADDPQQNLANTLRTLFAQIDPNILSRLSAGDVARDRLQDMAYGRNTGAIDSTRRRLQDAAISSGRYYDLARNVYGIVPQVFNSAYAQGQANDAAIGGFIPQIAAGYEAVANRPTQGIMNRIAAARAGQGIESQGIQNQLAGTQGYKTHQNWADKLSKVLKADEATVMQIAQMALSAYTGGLAGGMGGMGGMGGGGGGGLGSIFSGLGGGGGGGQPAYGSMYPGYGGMYQSVPNAQGGGFSQPRF